MLHRLSILILLLPALIIGAAENPEGTPPDNGSDSSGLNGNGCTCEDVSVQLIEEPAKLCWPAWGSPESVGAHVEFPKNYGVATLDIKPPVADEGFPGRLTGVQPAGLIGQEYAQSQGRESGELVWKAKVIGPDDECCQAVRVGLVNNLVSATEQVTWINGPTKLTAINRFANPATGERINPPMIDGGLDTKPYARSTAVKRGAKCDEIIELRYSDTPNMGARFEMVHMGVLRVFSEWRRDITIRLNLVYECPVGTYRIIKRWEWRWLDQLKLEWAADFNTFTVKHHRLGCIEGPSSTTADPEMVTTGPTANEAATAGGNALVVSDR